MFYLIAAISGFLLAVFLFSYSDLRRDFKRKAIKKRYRKLAAGTAKRVVQLTCWDDVWQYRNYPLYVNGQVLSVDCFDWWHCNDEYKELIDSQGNKKGYLICQHMGNRHRGYYLALAIAERPSFLGKVICPSAVIEVY